MENKSVERIKVGLCGLIITLIFSGCATPPWGHIYGDHHEWMKHEHEYQRESMKRHQEMEREEYKHQAEMNREAYKHQEELEREDRKREEEFRKERH